MLLKRTVVILITAALICSTALFAQQKCEELANWQTSAKKKLTIKGRSEWSIGSSEIRTSSGCMRFSAFLNSPELKSLQLRIDGSQRTFKRDGHVVDEYPDQVELVVEIWSCFDADGTLSPIPAEADQLRFKVGWVGSHSRESVNAEYTREAWTELSPAHRWYRMTLPTKGVRLSQPMEVSFESANLTEKCVSGQL